MASDPVVTYDGDVTGLPTTKPERGKKIDPGSPEVSRYADHVRAQHDAILQKVGGGKKLYEYVYAYDGFAARLTASQATRLSAQPDVVAVREDTKVSTQTSSTPRFLGLDARDGLWRRLGGPTGPKGAGDGLVIGVIDSGIWPDSRSFADPDTSGKRYKPVKGFHGTCPKGSDGSWKDGTCNGKLVAARHFGAGWGGDAALKEQLPWEFASPRDYNGHGTHVASTAGGNHGVAATGPAAAFGSISGIAPRARIAAYKALWSTADGASAVGYTSDLVAAIDQAVADGVDVINYSVSGTSTDFLDPVEMAFLAAAEAGVFVAAAGGNSGPAPSTAAHPSPWITTVAAGTHNRGAQGTTTLGNGATYTGASLASAKAGPAPLIDAAAAALPDTDATKVALCYAARDNDGQAVLDPAKVKGKIVVCDRGVTPRVNKSTAVKEAGGAGVILTNTDENSVNGDLHTLPTVHLPLANRQAVKDYAATGGASATIEQARISDDAPAPYVAAFSSRGPLSAGGGDLLKPDVIAPGQDILAAVAPPGHSGQDFDLSSGTSMSSPHVAGLAALLKDLHPSWSPMAVKSALMTTGRDVRDGPGTDAAVTFAQGAGHVTPNDAADPGLVYDSGIEDWLAFLCGSTRAIDKKVCDALAGKGYTFDASDLNLPSISVGRLSDTQTVTRKVTNVGDSTATYTASVAGLNGIETKVSPSRLTLRPGQSRSFTVTFTRTTAPMNVFQSGRLTWKDGRHHTVGTPLLVRPAQEKWASIYGVAGGVDSAEKIVLDPKGERVYVTGSSYGSTPGLLKPAMATVAYDAVTGAQVWTKTYVGPAADYDEPQAIELSPDGSKVFVAGISAATTTETDAFTIAYDAATGDELWTVRHNGAGGQSDYAGDITASPDGKSLYVTGMTSTGGGGEADYFTAAYDVDSGERTWLAHYGGPGGGVDDARTVVVTPDGTKVFVSGQSSGADGTGLTNWGTVAYDAGSGRQLWAAQHNGSGNEIDVSEDAAVSADGKVVFVTGQSVSQDTQSDMTTIAYDSATGKEVWTDRYDGPAQQGDHPKSVTVAPDGKVYVTGNSQGEGTRADYTTIAYDPATGARTWVARFDGQAQDEDFAKQVSTTPDGSKVIVTGKSADVPAGDVTPPNHDYVTVAYDAASGKQVWLGRYDGPAGAPDEANALAVGAVDGVGVRIFVTGASATVSGPVFNTEFDFTTVAYVEKW
ncbi:subtilisin family serine protease [Nonomuraea thailandensis]|uniref:Subtilisin family serine protease n=2 Tax=Nonomuraea thailandensis TaxID=1188745 RepID=A0A9X2JZA5_9ACTN|nr:subtilisin family serine protease [Nonomuraea thailandensis]